METTNFRLNSRISPPWGEDHDTLGNLQVRLARAEQTGDALGEDMFDLPEVKGPDTRQGTTRFYHYIGPTYFTIRHCLLYDCAMKIYLIIQQILKR